ncbi:MAG: RNA pseudouridine synthase, partial [Bacteroidaceae bacterium]|nr:RNA pseudouridine synthase [Bacteroidaceae bacterium]
DERYGGTQILRGQPGAAYKTFVYRCFDLCPRQALHARTLGFRHPVSGEEVDFDSPLPEDFQSLIARWRTYNPANN